MIYSFNVNGSITFYYLFFFLLLPGGPGMNGLLSPSPADGSSIPGIAPFTTVSVTTGVFSVMPLTISVLLPSVIPIFTGWAVKVLLSSVHTLCCSGNRLSYASHYVFVGSKAQSLVGNGQHIILGQCINGSVGGKTRFQFQIGIISCYHYLISNYSGTGGC